MNLPYLAKCLETNKLSDLIGVIDLVPLDLNLVLDEAVDSGEMEINREKDSFKILVENPDPYYNPELTNKLLRTIQNYHKRGTNPTRGRLNTLIKDPMGMYPGYLTHEYIMSMQYLVDSGQVVEEIVDLPAVKKKRPAHKFVFIGDPNNPHNAEWNARSVNKWIAQYEKTK